MRMFCGSRMVSVSWGALFIIGVPFFAGAGFGWVARGVFD